MTKRYVEHPSDREGSVGKRYVDYIVNHETGLGVVGIDLKCPYEFLTDQEVNKLRQRGIEIERLSASRLDELLDG